MQIPDRKPRAERSGWHKSCTLPCAVAARPIVSKLHRHAEMISVPPEREPL
jgi:hypothetical protein